MKRSLALYIFIAAAMIPFMASGQKYEYRVKAGFNIGGTSPLPLPAEIRSIEGYKPTLSLVVGADVTRHITNRWGIQAGLKFETKQMSTRASVKNYRISMVVSDGDATGYIDGIFTGTVKTRARNQYITMPVVATFQASPRWSVNLGPYFSVLINGGFDGEAYDGYIRDGDPTGEKVGVTTASYDFSKEVRGFNWGGQAGASWRAYRNFSVYGDLTIAANSIFPKKFDSISFALYNVYFNLGFAYTF